MKKKKMINRHFYNFLIIIFNALLPRTISAYVNARGEGLEPRLLKLIAFQFEKSITFADECMYEISFLFSLI